jgi:hypothetical protein
MIKKSENKGEINKKEKTSQVSLCMICKIDRLTDSLTDSLTDPALTEPALTVTH